MVTPFIFKCPVTAQNVQSWLDDNKNSCDDEYESISCPACTGLHFINRKTGKLLRADNK